MKKGTIYLYNLGGRVDEKGWKTKYTLLDYFYEVVPEKS